MGLGSLIGKVQSKVQDVRSKIPGIKTIDKAKTDIQKFKAKLPGQKPMIGGFTKAVGPQLPAPPGGLKSKPRILGGIVSV